MLEDVAEALDIELLVLHVIDDLFKGIKLGEHLLKRLKGSLGLLCRHVVGIHRYLLNRLSDSTQGILDLHRLVVDLDRAEITLDILENLRVGFLSLLHSIQTLVGVRGNLVGDKRQVFVLDVNIVGLGSTDAVDYLEPVGARIGNY